METKPTGIMQQSLIKHLFDLKFWNFLRIWIVLHRLLQSSPCNFVWLAGPLAFSIRINVCTRILLKPNVLLVLLQQRRFLASFSVFQFLLRNFCDVYFFILFLFRVKKVTVKWFKFLSNILIGKIEVFKLPPNRFQYPKF